MNVEQILENFYLWPIFELVAFFQVHTLVIKVIQNDFNKHNKSFA